MGRKRSFWGGVVTVALAAALAFCGSAPSQAQYKKAIEDAWQKTLAPQGISLRAFMMVLQADPSDEKAVVVANFYLKGEGFELLKEYFPSPEELQGWLVGFIRRYVKVSHGRPQVA